MGELEPGDAAAEGAGDAVREIAGRPLPAKGGRALNANLVLKIVMKRNTIIMRPFQYISYTLSTYLQVEHTGDQLQKTEGNVRTAYS